MSNISKYHLLRLYFKLKHEENSIEKTINTFMVNPKSLDLELWKSLKWNIDKSKNERQNAADSLKDTIINIHGELKSIKTMADKENIKNIDVVTFKSKLQIFWKKIRYFKNLCSNSINGLTALQSNITEDLNGLERLIKRHKYLNFMENCPYKNLYFMKKYEKEELTKVYNYKNIQNLSSLLVQAGYSGNWNDNDHLLFLKLRKKHKSIKSLIHAIQINCPDITKECIINHESWYKIYLEFRKKQKLAIVDWRRRKHIRQIRGIDRAEEIQPIPTTSGRIELLEHKKTTIKNKKSTLTKWKKLKKNLRAVEGHVQKTFRPKNDDIENLRQVVWVKKFVADSKEKKRVTKKLTPDKLIDSTQPPFMSTFVLHMYRLKDQQFLEKKQNTVLIKKCKFKPQSYVQSIKYKLSKSNESTLLKETKSWQEKHKKKNVKKVEKLFYIKDLPKRIAANSNQLRQGRRWINKFIL